MDDIIIIVFLSFLIIGIISWTLHRITKRELLKITNDFNKLKEEAMK
jgi:hypothetical protein